MKKLLLQKPNVLKNVVDSGDLTSDGQYMESIVTDSGYGTEDFDYSAFSR